MESVKKLKIGIIGAGRIGKFHVREFLKLGTYVLSILEPNSMLAKRAEAQIREKHKINVMSYVELNRFLGEHPPDAVSIATPPKNHAYYIEKCLETGKHVFVEKPLSVSPDAYLTAKKLLILAREKKLILTVNTQWPCVFPLIESQLPSLNKVREFYMYMEPGVRGLGMLVEHLPHLNSLLVKLISKGKAKNISFSKKEEEHIIIEFDYVTEKTKCKVKYELKYRENRPRAVIFSINGKKFERKILEGYKQKLITPDKIIDLEDPFTVSIRHFVQAIQEKRKPLICEQEILDNAKLQDSILEKWN